MDWLNYHHHLLYFWGVASEGSVTAACERLHLAQPAISSQLNKLEKSCRPQAAGAVRTWPCTHGDGQTRLRVRR